MTDETLLYFIRHGETDYNVKSIIQGQLIDCSINESGREQAALLATELEEVAFDRFYCSTLRRAIETAQIVSAPHSVGDLILMPELMEMSWGILEGQSFGQENSAYFENLHERWANGHFEDKVDGGESIYDVVDRSLAALGRIVAESAGRTVAVVTHGRLLRVLLSSVLTGHNLQEMEELLHRNTAFSRVRFKDGSYVAEVLCSDAHLNERVEK